MAAPLSLRLSDDALQRLYFEAKLEGIPPRTLAQRMIEEGMRMAAHPLIRFTSGPSGRRATLIGSGLDVWEVVSMVRSSGNDPAEAAETLALPVDLVEAGIAYYGAYPQEIDERIELNRFEAERGRAAYVAGLERLAG